MTLVYVAKCPECQWVHQKGELLSCEEQVECACCGKVFTAEWQAEEHDEPLKLKPEDIEPPTSPALSSGPAPKTVTASPNLGVFTSHPVQPIKVVVTDFDMTFSSMVNFMVKWAIAAIPATIIVLLLAFLAIAVFRLLLEASK